MVAFYNAADQELYKDYQFVPQEKYRTGFTAPVQGGGQDASTPSFGIPNTNAFTNSGGTSFNSVGNAFGYGSQIEPVSYGQYGAPGYMGGLPGNVQQYGIGRQFEDPSASPIGETYSYKKEVPGLLRAGAAFVPGGNFLLNLAEKKMNSNRDQSGSYSVAGLSEAQKGAYNNLAGEGMLFDGPSGLKTLTGKNFTGKGYMEGQIELAKEFGFDNMTDQEIEDAINKEKNRRSSKKTGQGFKYKQMLEASKMFKTNKAQQEKEKQDAIDKQNAIDAAEAAARGNYTPGGSHLSRGTSGGGLGLTEKQAQSISQANKNAGYASFSGLARGGRVNFKNGGLASIL